MTKANVSTSAAASKGRIRPFKRQRVDRLNDLRLDDPIIDRDARILGALREIYRRNSVQRAYQAALKTSPTLYCKLRGPRFPLTQRNGKKLPRWRSLSPWMKVQVGTVVLAEHGYLLFKVHLHDELRAELEARGEDQKDYLRNRITRCSRDQLGSGRWFFFVMEDLTGDGEPTRPHAHGAIELRRAQLPVRGETNHLHFRRLAEREGVEQAELAYGQLLTEMMLRVASGNVKDDRLPHVSGIKQNRNVWADVPKRPFLNDQYVTYAFKNAAAFSVTLGENRLAFSQSLRTEARRLWQLIREGEPAMSQWSHILAP